jgi:hypothetical protein
MDDKLETVREQRLHHEAQVVCATSEAAFALMSK